MKFLIAGLGSIGRRHLRNLLTLGQRDIILYRSYRASLPDDELAEFPVETDLHAALAHCPDAVIVSNPTALHLDVAIPAAQAGCHLLLEKPVSHSLERIDALRSALAQGGGQVLVGFQFRFHPALRRIRQWLAQDAIGPIVSLRAHWGEYLPGWHPWEDYRRGYAARPDLGGGVILTLCHPLDYLRWTLGECQVTWAMTSQRGLGLEVEDTAEIGLRFAQGAIGSVHLDFVQRPPQHSLEIIGAQGLIRAGLGGENADGSAQLFQAQAPDQGWRVEPPPDGFERNAMFLDQMRHFLAVASGVETPVCTLDDGLAAMRLTLSAYQSAALPGSMVMAGDRPATRR